jgi:hypothetical protein
MPKKASIFFNKMAAAARGTNFLDCQRGDLYIEAQALR